MSRRFRCRMGGSHGSCPASRERTGAAARDAVCSWFADSQRVDAHVWEAAVRSHDQWEHRLAEAAPATIAATRPIDFGNERYNEAFLWDVERGMRGAHAQSDLRDEDGVREVAWYNAATPEFTPIEVGAATVGFLVCTELWRMDQARTYGIEGVQLLLTPRSTGIDELESWLPPHASRRFLRRLPSVFEPVAAPARLEVTPGSWIRGKRSVQHGSAEPLHQCGC